MAADSVEPEDAAGDGGSAGVDDAVAEGALEVTFNL
jgi:hypothetical protein